MERIPRLPLRAWGVIHLLLPGHRCTVVMANGYRADAHLDKSLRHAPPHLQVGGRVHLEFSTYDLSNPRVIGGDEQLPDRTSAIAERRGSHGVDGGLMPSLRA